MTKLKLSPAPTFDASVAIHIPGADPAPVRFTFKHRTRDELLAWFESSKDASEVDTVLDVASGWELDDEFSRENVQRLCENYYTVGRAVLDTYLRELRGAREKN